MKAPLRSLHGLFVAVCLLFSTSLMAQPLSGNYTINSALVSGGTNYQSFADLAAALDSHGVSGPVTVLVTPGSGPYTEQVVIDTIQGASATNTVTIFGSGEILQATPTTTTRHILQLDGAKHVTIDSLHIIGLDTVFGFGIHLWHEADSNTIRNCIIDVSLVDNGLPNAQKANNSGTVVVSGSTLGMTGNGQNARYLTVENNELIGGYYGIAMNGGFPSGGYQSPGIVIKDNLIRDFESSGIIFYHMDGIDIDGNDIHRANRVTAGYFVGIGAFLDSRNIRIHGNAIHNTNGSSANPSTGGVGISISDNQAVSGQENRVYNNLIYDFNGGGNLTGIYNQSAEYLDIYHNTIVLDDTGSGSGDLRGFTQNLNSNNTTFRNNIVSVRRGSNFDCWGIWHTANFGTPPLISDGNTFVVEATGTGTAHLGHRFGTDYLTLSDWQAGEQLDSNSVEADPLFVDALNFDFTPTEFLSDNNGLALGLTEDFFGNSRPLTGPDPGAIEFVAAPDNIALVGQVSPQLVCSTTNTLEFSLANFGSDTLTSFWLYWTVNGGTADSLGFTGSLPPGDTASVVATNGLSITGLTNVVAWTAQPNGNTDPVPSNDTLVSVMNPGLAAGTYTINAAQATGGTNFQSFTDVADRLNQYGVCGPVVFDVVPNSGPYQEQVSLSTIMGASAINTILFQGNGDTLTFQPTSADRYLLRLDNARHVTVDSLVVVGESGSYGWGFHLTNGADSNTIRNCVIDLSATASNQVDRAAGVVLSNSTTDIDVSGNTANHLLLENNEIIGGYYGLQLHGGASGVGGNGNEIRDNVVRDFFYGGMRITRASNSEVSGNDIHRINRVSVGNFFHGIFLQDSSSNVLFEGNRIHGTHTSASNKNTTAYGIRCVQANATAGNEVEFVNNLLYDFDGYGQIIAMVNSASAHHRYYHNTLALGDSAGSNNWTLGFQHAGTSTGIDFRNNIISLTRKAGSNHTALVFSNLSTAVQCDHNVVYLSDTATTNKIYGAYLGNHETLADWIAGTSGAFGQNSFQLDPQFENPVVADFRPNAILLDSAGANLGVTEDFNGVLRSIPPDPGAMEFTIYPNDAGVSGLNLPNLFCTGTLQPVDVLITNYGNQTIDSVLVYWNVNSGPVDSAWYVGSIAPGMTDTLVAGPVAIPASGILLAWTNLPNNTADQDASNDSLSLVGQLSAMSGNYTINSAVATGGTNFNSFADAASSLHTQGVCSAVVIDVVPGSGPYNEQIELLHIPGSSPLHTVTINGNGESLEYAATNQNRYILRLNDVQHLILDSLVVRTLSNIYGFGIHFYNASDSNVIRNCEIDLSAITVYSSSSFDRSCGIAASGAVDHPHTVGDNTSFSIIENNEIIGGYFGISMRGNTNSQDAKGNQILNNLIRDFYRTGLTLEDADSAQVIGNEVTRPNISFEGGFIGIELETGNIQCRVERNWIHNSHGGTSNSNTGAVGVLISGSNSFPGAETKVFNNLIENLNPYNSSVVGITSSTSTGVHFIHNTIALDDPNAFGGDAYGFRQITGNLNVRVSNNIISVTRGGSGDNFAFDFLNPSANDMDRNGLYVQDVGAGDAYIGRYQSTTYATLADWQTAYLGLWDPNSESYDPQFTNPGAGDYTPQATGLVDIGTPQGVTTDFLGNPRSLVTPDPGAYEFTGLMTEMGLTTIISPSGDTCSPDSLPVVVEITSQGFAPQTGFVVTVDYSGAVTGTLNGTYTGTIGFDDTVAFTVGAIPNPPAGQLTLQAFINIAGDTNATNDTVWGSVQVFANPQINLGNDTSACQSSGFVITPGPGFASYNWSWANFTSTGTQLAPFLDTIYHVTVVDSNGCSASDSIDMTMFPKPNPGLGLGGSTTICPNQIYILDPGLGTNGYTYLWSDGSTDSTLGVMALGTYSVTVTNTFGCTALNAVNIVSYHNTQAAILGPDLDVCTPPSTQVVLSTPGSNLTYLWSDSTTAPTLTVTTTGTYWVQIATSNGCIDRDTVNVTFYSAPTVNVGPDTSYCGVPFQVDAGPGFVQYDWFGLPGNGQTNTINGPGTYWVTVWDSNGCFAQDTLVVDSCPVGISTLALGTLDLYPNPSREVFFLQNTGLDKRGLLEVLDATGRLVLSEQILLTHGSRHGVRVGEWPKGMYLIRLTHGGGIDIGRMVVN